MAVIIRPDSFPHGVDAFFTTKGVAIPADAARASGVDPDRTYLPLQKHTDRIVILESFSDLKEQKIADAVVTRMPDVLVGVVVADCVPVLIANRRSRIAAAVHAGWRGTAEKILSKTLAVMADRFHCAASETFVAIGPSIRGCCYEVGSDVAEKVEHACPGCGCRMRKEGREHLDLAEANRGQALSFGIPADNLWVSPECTACNPARFHSYRFTKGAPGRQGAFVMVRGGGR